MLTTVYLSRRPTRDERVQLGIEFPTLGFAVVPPPALVPRTTSAECAAPLALAWRNDARLAVGVGETGALALALDDDEPLLAAALAVLTRYQRWIARRNRASRHPVFDGVLARHRALHHLGDPPTRADYEHALDVWQWLLRLDGDASLALQIAGLFHRTGALRLRGALQPLTSDFLDEPLSPAVLARAAALVARHDEPGDPGDVEGARLRDADALSYLSLQSGADWEHLGAYETARAVRYELGRLSVPARARLAMLRLRPEVRALVDDAPRRLDHDAPGRHA